MNEEIKNEIMQIIKSRNTDCSVEEFKDHVNWNHISAYQKLSENFIREFKDKVNWYYISYYQILSENFIREFQDKVNWDSISEYQTLSEEFIKEFQDKINFCRLNISSSQTLSENFIREFQDRVEWIYISSWQNLSEDFIREFKDKVDWDYISSSQTLSENFIREFKDKVDWWKISVYQNLSEDFIKEFKDKIDIAFYDQVHRIIPDNEKVKEIKFYCKKHNLEIDEENKCFYAYREHDRNGAGIFNKTIKYENNKYYRDWHLDMRENVENSFGLGIFPKNSNTNTKVKVLFKDWGVEVDREDGKARVWGFEIVN
jgi:hypothetical protein